MANPFLKTGKSGAYSGTYRAEYRTPGQLKFLYQKIAWASANGLSTPQGGGITNTDGGLYSSAESRAGYAKDADGKDLLDEKGKKIPIKDGARFVPKPHLISIKSSNETDMGTVVSCEIAFVVYTIGQLQGQAGFFKIGGDLNASWGWSTGDAVSFTGKIVNFSYSLNNDGGFDCTSKAIGKGVAIPGINPNAAIKGEATYKDALEKEFSGNNLWTNLYAAAGAVVGPDGKTSKYEDGLGGFAIEEAWTTLPATPEEKIPEGQTKMYLYCSLQKIVDEVNKILTKVKAPGKILSIEPWVKTKFVAPGSASPLTVLLSAGPYGAINFDGMPTVTTNPGDVAISIDFLKELCLEIEGDNKSSGKSRDITLSNFFDQIFTEISESTGNACHLTLAAAKDRTNIIICDSEDTPDVGKGMITAVTQGGEARSMSVVSQLPAEVTSMAYVATNSDAVKVGNVQWNGISGAVRAKVPSDWAKAYEKLGLNGAFPETVAAAKSELAAEIKNLGAGGTVPLPIDFSVVVDGQPNFEWGMSITSNYLPSAYRAANVHFAITRVEHSVQNGDWTTSLSTIMRLLKT